MGTKFWLSMIVFALGAVLVFFGLSSEWNKVKGVTEKKIKMFIIGLLYVIFGGWLVYEINKDEIDSNDKLFNTLEDIKKSKTIENNTTIYVDSSKFETNKPTLIYPTIKRKEETPHLSTILPDNSINPVLYKINNNRALFIIKTAVIEENQVAKELQGTFIPIEKVNGKYKILEILPNKSNKSFVVGNFTYLIDSIYMDINNTQAETLYLYFSVNFSNNNFIKQPKFETVFIIKRNPFDTDFITANDTLYDEICAFVVRNYKH